MLGRREILLAGVALTIGGGARAALPVPPDRHVAFRIMRHGNCIGTHALDFVSRGSVLDVDITVDVLVSLGPIPFVRYKHHARESWDGERLVGLSSHTDRNGRELSMEAARTASGLSVEGSGTQPYIAPPNAFATTYWRKASLFGPLIGTQDGGLVHPAISQPRPDPVRLASGAETAAHHYVLTGDLALELWYDSQDAWVGMRFEADDGSVISYERV